MKKKILIIEDREHIASIMQEYLDEQGYHTEVAMSGQEAISKFRNVKFDLLVTDYRLPDMDGKTVVKKCLTVLPDLKVLFVSEYVQELNMKTGPNCKVIAKPCHPSKILEAIRSMT